jgi:FMN-dependent NADH-azoreductase
MKLLHIDSSVLGPHSVSRQVSAAIVDRLQKSTPDLNVTYRDLTATPLAHLSGSHLAAAQGPYPKLSRSSRILPPAGPCWRSFWPPTSW